MTEDRATYDATPCECGCGNPARTGSRYYEAACRARASRQRATALRSEHGQVKRCQVIKNGNVSITLHLPPKYLDRIDKLQPGAWVGLHLHGSRER